MEHLLETYGEYFVWLLFGSLVISLLILVDSFEERNNLKKEARINETVIKNMQRYINVKIMRNSLSGLTFKRHNRNRRTFN